MKIKSSIKTIFRYVKWRIKNPAKPFHFYYIANVQKSIDNLQKHPTLGVKILDRERFFNTANVEMDFLIKQGLLPHHKIVDYGCGSLRLGTKLIPYLEMSNYIGLDMTDVFYSIGKSHIGSNNLDLKHPILKTINSVSLNEIKQLGIDYVISTAVLYHIPYKELHTYFANILFLLKPDGKAFFDFTNGEKLQKTAWSTWIYPHIMIEKILRNLNGKTKLHELGEEEKKLYPSGHRIMEISHNQ